jgi:hypothetical protein
MKIAVYLSHFGKVGGVETTTLNLCKALTPFHDVTLIMGQCDNWERILKDVDCNVFLLDKNKDYHFNTVIMQSSWGYNPLDKFHAKKYIQIIHSDYTYYYEKMHWEYVEHPKINYRVAVGQYVKRTFEKLTGKKIHKIIYNFV